MLRFSSILILSILICSLQSRAAEELVPKSSNQFIVVQPKHRSIFNAEVTLWQRSVHGWEVSSPMEAVVGRNGIAPSGQKREGDGRTPSGAYKFGTAFGYDRYIPTQMTYRQSTDEDVWIDDTNSKKYNHWVNIQRLWTAKSFERMRREDDLYKIGIVIDYNSHPVILGYGSAIFLHIWRSLDKPTSGCVALSEENVFKILNWLNPYQNPMIVIKEN
jgi:L,D-peptidoglycan transpeptidase YkuD (ErfK/YbiS/YcfS/YnhG family)